MLHFLQSNAATVILIAVIAFLVFLALRKIIRDRKSGIGPCGQKCSDCTRSAQCNKQND